MERPRLPLGDYWQALIQHQLLAGFDERENFISRSAES